MQNADTIWLTLPLGILHRHPIASEPSSDSLGSDRTRASAATTLPTRPRVQDEEPSEVSNPRGTGEYGICYVRYGKAITGSAPKRRSVLTVWGWVPEVLEEWITQFRPLLAPPGSVALWPSERAARIGLQQLNSRFAAYRDALGLPGGLDFHSLRRSYVTHLVEDGWDARFVQEQAGHEHASTTSIYTCVSSDFRTRTLRRVLDQTVRAALARRAT
jgi:integrase/recombinase XerC